MRKKGAFSLLSFVLTTALTIGGISIVIVVLLPAIERVRTSEVLDDAIEQLKILDSLITQVASESVGTQVKYELSVRDGRFIVDNLTNTIKFKYEKYFPYLEGVFKEWGNVILSAGPIPNISCSIKFNSCDENESCVFSLYREENSHIGNCSAYDYKVCCKNLNSSFRRRCTGIETKIFSLYKNENSHAAYDERLNFSVCITPEAVCELRSACLKREVCIISFYKDENSHAARCGYYPNQLCCEWRVREEVEVLLKYKRIKIIGSGVFPRGNYELCIEKVKEVNNIAIIEVVAC